MISCLLYMIVSSIPQLRMQKCIGFVQWYFLGWASLAVLIAISIKDFCLYEIVKYHFLKDHKLINSELNMRLPNSTGTLLPNATKAGYYILEPIRIGALVAPFVGVLAMVTLTVNLFQFARGRKNQRREAAIEAEKYRENNCGWANSRVKVQHEGMRVEYEAVGSKHWSGTITGVVAPQNGVGEQYLVHGTKVHPSKIRFTYARQNFWMASVKDNAQLCLILLPGVFILMAIRAEIRILELMTGSAARTRTKEMIHLNWEGRIKWLESTFDADLEVAMAFQFVTVVAFGCLCSKYFGITSSISSIANKIQGFYSFYQKPPDEDERIMDAFITTTNNLTKMGEQSSSQLTWAGLQGIWAYSLLGFSRCMLALAIKICKEHDYNKLQNYLETTIFNNLSMVFSFFTFVCIINMVIILKMPQLTSDTALGKRASLKFLACRGLLLISQMQMIVLDMASKYVLGDYLNVARNRLINASLLIVECFLVAIWNYFAWRPQREHLAPLDEYEELTNEQL